jgi:hypothetical protein
MLNSFAGYKETVPALNKLMATWALGCSPAVTLRTHSPMKMEQTKCSETLPTKLHTPENNPKENIQHSKHCENRKSRIIHLYGKETAKHIRLLENLRIKKSKLLTSLIFLLR